MEGTSGDLLSKLLLQAGSAVGSDKIVQGFIQSGLEHFWQTVWPPWAACPTAWCPHGEKVPLFLSHSEPLMFQLMHIVSCPPTMLHCAESGSVSSMTSSEVLGGCCQVPWCCLFFMLNKLQVLSFSSQSTCSSSNHPSGPCWPSLSKPQTGHRSPDVVW